MSSLKKLPQTWFTYAILLRSTYVRKASMYACKSKNSLLSTPFRGSGPGTNHSAVCLPDGEHDIFYLSVKDD